MRQVNNSCLVLFCNNQPLCLPVGVLAAGQFSWPDRWLRPRRRRCLVYLVISVSFPALLTLQDRGHTYRGPCPGHKWGQPKRKTTEWSNPPPANGWGVRHPQDQETNRAYVGICSEKAMLKITGSVFPCSPVFNFHHIPRIRCPPATGQRSWFSQWHRGWSYRLSEDQ